jgi:glutathione S-transferase
MKARLYAGPASHPSMAAALMLDRKEIEYEVVWLLLPLSGPVLRLRGFPSRTVPALRLGTRKFQGSRLISNALEDLVPDPPLFPGRGPQRRAVEDAERFGEEKLQPLARRVVVWSLRRDSSLVAHQLAEARTIQGAHIPISPALMRLTSGPTLTWYAHKIGADTAAVQADLHRLPAMLDRVETWISAGVLGRDPPTAADFQIATSLGQLMTVRELQAYVEPRPAGQLSRGLVPDYPGRSAGLLKRDWLAAAGIQADTRAR